MTGIEIAVGYVFAWVIRKSKRVAGRADGEVDRTLDTAMDRLHDLVSARLGEDPALRRLTEEAEAGADEPSDRTRRRVHDALEEAAEQDPGFAEALNHAVKELQGLSRQAGGTSAGDAGVAVGGNVEIRADRGSVAGWNVDLRDVTLGNPPPPGPHRG
ncbi:hypothetical protein ACFZB9_10980 [Kitasatospora sp. NPDC008050]|uniref:hypothetical protein n=1 Tax=Kitasatospora sp. NPDC008050 TaxID=3364021 RepID=UPI0036E5A923